MLPEHKLVAIALDDAFSLGILSSQLHICWALATGGTLEDRPVYSKSTCFDTFPFPDEDTGLTPALRERIAQLAEQIDAHRKQVLAAGHQGLTLTGIYNVLAALREGRALTAKEKTQHTQGLVGVLRELHDELDVAVLTAYGLSADADTDTVLHRLVALNAERAREEAQGHIRWLRPSFQNPQKTMQKQELLTHSDKALEGDLIGQKSLSKQEQKAAIPWPKALPEQIQALANALTAQPQTAAQLAAHFKGRSLAKALLPLLETLAVLGRAHKVSLGREEAWRA